MAVNRMGVDRRHRVNAALLPRSPEFVARQQARLGGGPPDTVVDPTGHPGLDELAAVVLGTDDWLVLTLPTGTPLSVVDTTLRSLPDEVRERTLLVSGAVHVLSTGDDDG